MTNYITEDELRNYIGSEALNSGNVLSSVCTVASRAVETMCERTFLQDDDVSVRYFEPCDYFHVEVDDISTATGLIVRTDDSGTGSYSTTWTLDTDFFLEPINQRSGGIGGWPYTEIHSLLSRAFIRAYVPARRPSVKVTARWGWAAVPDQVKQATLIAAARLFKMKDAPDGFVGLDGWGPVRVKENPEVRALLGPFMKHPVVVA